MSAEKDGKGTFNHFQTFGVAFGLSSEAGQELADIAVHPFNHACKMLGSKMLVVRDNMPVGSQFICSIPIGIYMPNLFPEALGCFDCTAAHFKGEESAAGTVTSKPYPDHLFFCPIKW